MTTEPFALETAWWLRGPVGRIVECMIVPADTGFIVQVGHGATEITRACTVASMQRARRKAEEWRTALLSLSEFTEVER